MQSYARDAKRVSADARHKPSSWQTQVNEALSAATARGLEENKLFDTVMGQAMSVLRGRVPAVRVVHVIHELQARKNDNG